MSSFFALACCVLFAGLSQPEYFLRFTRIDNQVNVYVNGQLVYESEVIDGNPDLDIRVGLTKHLKEGLNTVKIELYNGSDFNKVITDSHWEVRYELLEDGEGIDYMHQLSDKGDNGLSFEYEHKIYLK